MATIKFRRGAGQPTGLTAYEPAWDTTNNRLFVNNGSTAVWVGSPIVNDSTLSGNCAWTVPTQFAVKTYVDNQVSGGAVSSINGATGAVTIGGGTGISILTSTSARGVTIFNAGVLSINGNTGAISNVAFTNVAQTFTQLQTFSAGISASSGAVITGLATLFNDLDLKGGLTVGGSARFTSATSFNSGVSLINGPLSINGTIRNDSGTGITFSTGIRVSDDSTFSKNLAVSGALNVTGGGTFGSLYVVGPAAIDGAVTLLGGFDAKGATFGNLVRFVSGISANGGMTLGGSLQAAAASFTTGSFSGLLSPSGGINASGGMTLAGTLQGSTATFSGLVTANSGLVVSGGVTFNGNIYAPNLVTSVDGVTGAVDLLAGSGISITVPTGAAKGITLTNIGVVGITGTANQVSVSATTGSVTLSLPSAITTPGSLTTTSSLLVGTDATITGNLTVNGTTTTVNSTTVTVQDPLIAIGGITGNAPPPVGDTKDRGIVFQWASGVTGQTGFFGFDQSTQRFTFIPSGAAISGEIVSGAAGNAELAGVFAPSGTLTLQGTSGASAVITLAGNTAGASTVITNTSFETLLTSSTGVGRLSLRSDAVDPSLKGTFVPTTLSAARSYTLPDISGQMVLADTAGATTGWLLRGQGSATQNTWINPNAAGFTAFTSERINLTAVKDAVNYGLVFALGTAGNQVLYGDSTTGVMWRPSTNTLTVGAGLGFFEGIIEGGTF